MTTSTGKTPRTAIVLPRNPGARVLLASVVGLAIAAYGASWWMAIGMVDNIEDRVVIFSVFAALLILLEMKPMNTELSGRVSTFAWTFAFTLVLIAPLHLALTAAVAAGLGGSWANYRAGRTPAIGSGFDTSSSVISLFAAGLAGNSVGNLDGVALGAEPELRWLLAVLWAVLVGFAVSALLNGLATALTRGLPITHSIVGHGLMQIRTDGFLFGLAPIFAVVGTSALILLPVLLLVVWVILHSASEALSSEHRATTDVLTGVPNRRTFETEGSRILERVASQSGCAAIVHLDLDGFKAINDRLGHQYGDGVLCQVASRLDECRRSVDLLARLGGDEFAFVLGDVANAAEAETVARRILRLVEEPLTVEGIPLQVSASLGVAMYPDHGSTLSTVLHHADLAMYRAKTDDVGVSLYSDGIGSAPGRLSLVSELGDAISSDQLELYYQPKVDMASGRILTVEALLRWNHPEHGQVNPGWFMPMAEQTDLMRDLTDFVLQSALSQCAQWHRKGIEVGVAVNASARNLHDFRFPNRIRSFLADVGLEAKWLEVEITENTIMEDPRRSASVMADLQSLGVSVSIDDFGTGYSSLATLRSLTIDRIKIDQSFIMGLAEGNADLTIVRSVVELGRNLGLSVVAEGVETDEVLAIVRSLGVDEFQGYLASRPMRARDLEPVLIHGYFHMDPIVGVEEPLPLAAQGAEGVTDSSAASACLDDAESGDETLDLGRADRPLDL